MSSAEPHIVVIGAGFCGTMVAVHLLRRLTRGRLTLVNRPAASAQKTLARGLAYGTASPHHVLNVPAGRMSAFDDAPDDFVRFLRAQGVEAAGGSFAPRHRYGAYLAETLRLAAAAVSPTVAFEVCARTVQRLVSVAGGQRVECADGTYLTATQVVLALGHFAPAHPAGIDTTVAADDRYVRDPWEAERIANLPLDAPVLLIGTGLTMYDVALSLAQRGRESGPSLRLMAVSRRGLAPRAHRSDTAPPTFEHVPATLQTALPRARAYLRSVRAAAEVMAVQGGDWRDVMAGIRPLTPGLWQRLPLDERRRFLRHLRPWWDVHRHRAAPEIAIAIRAMIDAGALSLQAARIVGVRMRGASGFTVSLLPRGAATAQEVTCGAIVNCTGPSSDIRDEPLLRELQAAGRIAADPLRLGLDVGADYRPRSADGTPAENLFYVGPLLRAGDWEATAVPELRGHALRCAEAVLRALA